MKRLGYSAVASSPDCPCPPPHCHSPVLRRCTTSASHLRDVIRCASHVTAKLARIQIVHHCVLQLRLLSIRYDIHANSRLNVRVSEQQRRYECQPHDMTSVLEYRQHLTDYCVWFCFSNEQKRLVCMTLMRGSWSQFELTVFEPVLG